MQINKFMNRMFRRISSLVWDVTTGAVGVKTDQGIFTVSFDDNNNPTLNVNPLDSFGLAIPAFATQVVLADVKIADLVCGDTAVLGWVVDKTPAALKLMDHTGRTFTWAPPKVAIMGTQGVLVVQTLISLTGSPANAQGFAGSLLPLLMMGGEGSDSKLEKMIPFLLMSQQSGMAGGAGTAAPAGGPVGNLMPLLMMMNAGGLGDLFGGSSNGPNQLTDLLPFLILSGLGGATGAGGGNSMLMMAAMMGGQSETKPLVAGATRSRGIPPLTPLV